VRNVGAGFNIAAKPEQNPAVLLHSVAISDNIVSNMNVGEFTGSARAFMTQGAISDVTITHNTVYNETVPYATLFMGPVGEKTVRFTFSDNIAATATNWGILGDNTGAGIAAINEYAPTGTMTNNVFAGNSGYSYPVGNFFTPGVSGVGFSAPASGDFTLLVSSPFKGKASDGRDPGANISEVLKATNGVVQ
jgi:hypothetical protein